MNRKFPKRVTKNDIDLYVFPSVNKAHIKLANKAYKFISMIKKGGVPVRNIITTDFKTNTNVEVFVEIPYPFHKVKGFNRFSKSDALRAIKFYKDSQKTNRNYRKRQRRYNQTLQ